ncbi:hypothetical protein [Rathayibacter sp. PhB151]|nr:hypothetical protein [Rathayibacter sp. PhB151]
MPVPRRPIAARTIHHVGSSSAAAENVKNVPLLNMISEDEQPS